MNHSTISPKVDMRYWELEKLAEQASVLVPVGPGGNWDSARVRIHQLCKGLGWRVATREAPEGWQVYRVDGSGQGVPRAPERTLRAPYDRMDRLREAPVVVLECGKNGQTPVRETVTSRAYQIARKRGWRVRVHQVPSGVEVHRLDHPDSKARPRHALRPPYDQLERLATEEQVLVECGKARGWPTRKTVNGRIYQIAREREWEVTLRQVPRGVRVYRVDRLRTDSALHNDQTYWLAPECLRDGDILRLVLSEPDDMDHAKRAIAAWCQEEGVSIRFVSIEEGVVDVMPR